jgi:hypothetical protein
MQLSFAIRAAVIALTVIGAGLATAYADGGSIRFNVIKAGFVVAALAAAARWCSTAGVIRCRSAG